MVVYSPSISKSTTAFPSRRQASDGPRHRRALATASGAKDREYVCQAPTSCARALRSESELGTIHKAEPNRMSSGATSRPRICSSTSSSQEEHGTVRAWSSSGGMTRRPRCALAEHFDLGDAVILGGEHRAVGTAATTSVGAVALSGIGLRERTGRHNAKVLGVEVPGARDEHSRFARTIAGYVRRCDPQAQVVIVPSSDPGRSNIVRATEPR